MTDELHIQQAAIPGLLVVHLPVHADARGWFKENWQREKMTTLGLPDFEPVQNNISYSVSRGVTRGIKVEPWDKFVSVASGRVFAAWVDLREGASFGATFHMEIDESVAVFVPRGVGNAYQALEDGTAYCYLINDHFVPGRAYPALNLADETVAIPWPIALTSDEAKISAKDRDNPRLVDVAPVKARRTLVLGGDGRLGRALAAAFPHAEVAGRDDLDITSAEEVSAWPWDEYAVVLNAAAYTAVDAAETPEGRRRAWAVNAIAVSRLAAVARAHQITLVHYSSACVFGEGQGEGSDGGHTESETFSPLSVYGHTKAAGDLAAVMAPRHYLLRTSWLVDDGEDVAHMLRRLSGDGVVGCSGVGDQVGRLTATGTLAAATQHLLDSEADYGVYNVTGGGEPCSLHDIAAEIVALGKRGGEEFVGRTTSIPDAMSCAAAQHLSSVLTLDKIRATGFEPEPHFVTLRRQVAGLRQAPVPQEPSTEEPIG